MEYTLPLVTHWVKKQIDRVEIERKMENAYKRGMNFIFGKEHPLTLLEELAGLGSFKFRIDQLEASLARHLANMKVSNPLYSYMQKNFISENRNFIISHCRSSNLHKEWISYRGGTEFPLKYSTWIRHRKTMNQTLKKGKLHRYVMGRCKTRSGIDNLLKETGECLKLGMSWRTNCAFNNLNCPACFGKFNRSHLRRCNIYQLIDIDADYIFASENYQRDIKELTTTKAIAVETYTLLDYYLNNKDYDKFILIYKKLQKLLVD
jgi:hypothetical protein